MCAYPDQFIISNRHIFYANLSCYSPVTISTKTAYTNTFVIMLSRLTFAGRANKLANAKHDVKQYDSQWKFCCQKLFCLLYEYNISFLVLDPCSEGCETRWIHFIHKQTMPHRKFITMKYLGAWKIRHTENNSSVTCDIMHKYMVLNQKLSDKNFNHNIITNLSVFSPYIGLCYSVEDIYMRSWLRFVQYCMNNTLRPCVLIIYARTI